MLSIEEFDIKLETHIIGRNFTMLDEVDSTNKYALSKKQGQYRDGEVIFTEFQSEGRGRLDRKWVSSREQNLLFSILLNMENRKIQHPQLLNFAAALSVARSIENLHFIKTNLKWPNDVMIENRKVAGILCQSVSQGASISRVAVGIGVNVNQNNFSTGYSHEPTSLKIELKQMVSRERLFAEILNNFELNLKKLENDPAQIVSEWKQFCKYIGDQISVKTDNKEIFGILDDISPEGHLIVIDNMADRHIISFGDVSAI